MCNKSNLVLIHAEQVAFEKMLYSLLLKTTINTLHLAVIAFKERHAKRNKLIAKRGCS
jgi:hypothetical protein